MDFDTELNSDTVDQPINLTPRRSILERENLEREVEKLQETVAQLLKTSNNYLGRISGLENSMRITDTYIGEFKKKISRLEDELQKVRSGRA